MHTNCAIARPNRDDLHGDVWVSRHVERATASPDIAVFLIHVYGNLEIAKCGLG